MRRSVLALAVVTSVIAGIFFTAKPYMFKAKVSADAKPANLSSYQTKEGLPDANAIFDLVNEQRQANGKQPLTRNAELTVIAQQRAKDMAANHYYAHQSPKGLYFYDLLKQANYGVAYACENLDLEFTQIPSVYVTDWMNSTHGHRECMLNTNITDAGYAVTEFKTSDTPSNDMPTYIVVTIYAQLPATIAQK